MKLSVIVASKGRANMLYNLLQSLSTNSHDLKSIEFIFGMNEEDKEEMRVLNKCIEHYKLDAKIVLFRSPYYLNDKVNAIARQASGDIICGLSNDLVCKTKNWDKLLIDEFKLIPEDNIYAMWINDGLGSTNLPRHYIITRTWMDIVGRYTADCLIHYYSDNWMYEVSQKINRGKYLEHIQFDHYSPYTMNIPKTAEIAEEEQRYFAIDNHTFKNTLAFRDYDVLLLQKYLKENNMKRKEGAINENN